MPTDFDGLLAETQPATSGGAHNTSQGGAHNTSTGGSPRALEWEQRQHLRRASHHLHLLLGRGSHQQGAHILHEVVNHALAPDLQAKSAGRQVQQGWVSTAGAATASRRRRDTGADAFRALAHPRGCAQAPMPGSRNRTAGGRNRTAAALKHPSPAAQDRSCAQAPMPGSTGPSTMAAHLDAVHLGQVFHVARRGAHVESQDAGTQRDGQLHVAVRHGAHAGVHHLRSGERTGERAVLGWGF